MKPVAGVTKAVESILLSEVRPGPGALPAGAGRKSRYPPADAAGSGRGTLGLALDVFCHSANPFPTIHHFGNRVKLGQVEGDQPDIAFILVHIAPSP